MQDHFLQYLDQTVPPEGKLLYQEAIETLIKAGIQDHVFLIDQMMEQDDLGDAGSFILRVNALLVEAIHSLMLLFGVTLAPECPLDICTDILKGTLAMDNWSDPQSLAGACDTSEGTESAFATLLGLVTQRHETDYLPQLQRVSPSMIDRIDALNQSFHEDALPSDEERMRAQARLNTFFAHCSAPILSQAIGEMLLLGGSYQGLLAQYEEEVSALPMESAVNELVGFALASDLEASAIEAAILAESQGWWDANPSAAKQLSTLVRTRLKEAAVL